MKAIKDLIKHLSQEMVVLVKYLGRSYKTIKFGFASVQIYVRTCVVVNIPHLFSKQQFKNVFQAVIPPLRYY